MYQFKNKTVITG